MAPYPEGVKPNHYFHDSLGDPYTCTGDHNHPEDEDFARNTPQEEDQVRADLEERAAELARNAKCGRCDKPILDSGDALATTFIKLKLPGSGRGGDYNLCGTCGISLRAFLTMTGVRG